MRKKGPVRKAHKICTKAFSVIFPGNCESGLNITNEPMKIRFSNRTPDATAKTMNSVFLIWKYTELHLIIA
ncbi:MAG: hypothetical protein EHM85_01265 [Desulfobacteraceae bacterium]|nr:MAG: hypothetical protein EHM85_01265 [Desulfobacteraceae bacterium]